MRIPRGLRGTFAILGGLDGELGSLDLSEAIALEAANGFERRQGGLDGHLVGSGIFDRSHSDHR